jgi:hypothetical protein
VAEKDEHQAPTSRRLTLNLDHFSWSAIAEEAHKLGVSAEELARFAVLYYLADLDSGRIARRIQSQDKLSLQDASASV